MAKSNIKPPHDITKPAFGLANHGPIRGTPVLVERNIPIGCPINQSGVIFATPPKKYGSAI